MAKQTTKKSKPAAKPKRSAKVSPTAEAAVPVAVASGWQLAGRALAILRQHWTFFVRLAVVYLVLDLLFVQTITQLSTATTPGSGVWGDAVTTFSTFLTNAVFSSGDASELYHLFLMLLIGLAAIWGLRRLATAKNPATVTLSAKLALYRGTGQLVPFMLVGIVMVLQLLPLAIALFLYNLMTTGLILASGFERVVAFMIVVLLLVLTLVWLARTIMALYAVTEPNTMPLAAYYRARRLVAGRRIEIVRKLLLLPLGLMLIAGIITIPLILLSPSVAKLVFYLLIPFGLIATHTYLYTLYKELERE